MGKLGGIMAKLYVKQSSIHVASGKCDRILVLFPHPVCANRALAWCRKHSLGSAASAHALVKRCEDREVKTFGRAFGKEFGTLCGIKGFKVELEDLTK
jgi:hypothetical protein